ncbi:Asparagine-tRNA ligase [Quillaja saponaria]|uniref:Asparagine-tRNA ligase n=1 Tax=Quillaja saponaria TaxID=32244 RepID=A0AAD7PP07_QUISA|nr:Asparagine-tRNA ligase [Quillaja saponaria]
MASEDATAASPATYSKYSNRVVLKTLLESSDGGLGLVGQRVVIGGWVRSSKEVMKEPVAPLPPIDNRMDEIKSKDVSCVEILQSRIPLFRSIIKVLGGSGYTIREKFETVAPKPSPPPPSTACLQVTDGSCVANLQVLVDSSIASPSQLLPTGTCILVEGVLRQAPGQGKHVIELKAEKVLHIGTVDHDKYPLSKKRLPLDMLRDYSQFRPRTTTVASVMRIRSALSFATHLFFRDHQFLHVQVPIITTTDCEGYSNMFKITSLVGKTDKKEEKSTIDTIEGVSLDVIKAALKEKSNLVENLKRSESNKEALAVALQDLRKTNELVSQLDAREKLKYGTSVKTDKVNISEEFFSCQTYLTVSGRLHLESYACALGNVYAFGPRFHADKTESSKHAAEMWMVEIEMAFSQLEDSVNCASDYFKHLCKWVLENCSEDMRFVAKRIDSNCIDRLQLMTSSSFEKISYTEALNVLKQIPEKKFETNLEWGVTLTVEHLSYLADDIYKKPVIIYNYPKEVKPFYVRLNDDGKTVAAFDMVVPKVGTLISGSQSEERLNMITARIKELHLPRDQYEWYLDLRRHGSVRHSGFTLRFDLMVLFITGLTNVRDAIPFPRSYGKAKN